MNLIEIDVVHVQSLQTGIARLEDMLAAQA